eukprot:scaffold7622_cov48-Attheya_sp.AAC.2
MLLASRAISYTLAVEGETVLVVLGFLVVLVVMVVVDSCPCSNGRAVGVAGSERRRITGGRPGQLAMGH